MVRCELRVANASCELLMFCELRVTNCTYCASYELHLLCELFPQRFPKKLSKRQENDDESLHRNKSNRPIFTKNSEINQICNFMELLQLDKIISKDSLSEVERTALSELQTNNDIIIKRADKGGNFVIMDKDFYRDKLALEGHLNTNDYKRVNDDEDIKVMKDLKTITKKYEKELATKEQQFICDFPWKTSNFYALPKIHKSTGCPRKIVPRLPEDCDKTTKDSH